MVRGPQFEKRWYSLLLVGYKPVQHVPILNTVGNCNTVVSIIIIYYIMGPPSYMRSVVDRNVVMRRMTVLVEPSKYFSVERFTMYERALLCFKVIKLCPFVLLLKSGIKDEYKYGTLVER